MRFWRQQLQPRIRAKMNPGFALAQTLSRAGVGCLACWLALAPGFGRAATPSPLKLKEVVVAKAETGAVPASVVLGPDFQRFAYVAIQSGKQLVFVDGHLAATLDGVGFGTPAFSADGKRLMFVGIRGASSFVSVDGVEGKSFEGIHRAQFSPDGKRVLAVAQRGSQFFVAVDGMEGPTFEQIGEGDPEFSARGNRLAYAARRDGKWLLVADGELGPAFDAVGRGVKYFSDDGKTLAYLAVRGGKWLVIVNGVEGKEYDAITDLVIGDGGKVAYRAVAGAQQRIVLNGKEGPARDLIVPGSLAFSKDGTRFGYGEKSDGLLRMVLDETRGEGMISLGPPVFAPAGKRVAYKAARDLDALVVLDNKPGPSFPRLALDPPVFSPDGSRLAYGAQRSVSWVVVADDAIGVAYDDLGLGSLTFSPDSKHLAYWVKRSIYSILVVDGAESPEYRAHFGKPPLRWANGSTVVGFALRGSDFVRIEAEAPPQK